MGPRGAGRRLNDQERMEILEIIQREAKVKNVDLAKRYGVSEGAIRKLKQMKDTIRNRYYTGNEHNRDKRKRGGFKRNAPFEEELYQWIVRMRETQPYQLMPLTQTAVRQQAIVLAKNYDKMANFKASPGWFARFCSRHRLDPIVAGAGAAAAAAAAAAEAAGTAIVDVGDPTALSAEGVPQAVAVPPAVSTDETVYLMDTLAPAVTTTQVMEMVDEAAAEMAPAAEEEGAAKTDTPSINEQVHQAARQHNEAMLRAAAAKIEEAQAATEADAATEQSETSEPALLLCLGCFWIKLRKIKPIINEDASDPEDGSNFPMVLVQIPMCNEKEVFAQSIGAVCQLDWPKERFLVQVLDDSDDEVLQKMIRNECLSWKEKGVNIIYRHRFIRTGYKAGNLKSAMACDYVQDYEFVAIFDADFQPNPDFLKLTVPHFKGKPDVGLVQARWTFVNKDENLLTRLQNINLCFHFEVEQQVNGHYLNFFGFNGTAGVWRIKALEESGGWLERTTVEDMDIAVRAHLCGWKFIYVDDVKALCELPESYEAYKKQQHRWHSGPMQLFRLCLPSILKSKISAWKKANLILLFFLLRKLILPFYSFTLFCIILPLTMFIPEAELPPWVICYIPIVMSILNILPSPKSFPFLMPYLLFENTMSVTKFNAMVSGLFQLGSAYEWVVTKKTGRASESDLLALAERESKNMNEEKISRRLSESGLELFGKLKEHEEVPKKKKANKIYRKELALAFLLLTAAARSLLSAQGIHFYYLLFQGLTFLIVGLDLIGEQVS